MVERNINRITLRHTQPEPDWEWAQTFPDQPRRFEVSQSRALIGGDGHVAAHPVVWLVGWVRWHQGFGFKNMQLHVMVITGELKLN